MDRIIAAFTGASGTGKSTLLNLLQSKGLCTTVELSGRPYLPTSGDYIENKSDSTNRRIAYGSTVTFTAALLKRPHDHLFFSRCSIDKLAYGRALGVGTDLFDVTIKEIEYVVKPFIQVFYLPVEFPLTDGDDTVRGTNELVRTTTDENIQRILQEFNIPHIVVKGTVEERMKIITESLFSHETTNQTRELH
jgi:predicted ATPase